MKAIQLLILSILCLTLNLHAQKKPTEPKLHIFSIYFGGGDYSIDKQQIKDLSDFIDGIPNIENYAISVHGHTDNIGSVEYNNWLSNMRTEMTLQEMTKKQIPRDIITISDFGEHNPIYDNSTHEGRVKNRRVDVIIKPLIM